MRTPHLVPAAAALLLAGAALAGWARYARRVEDRSVQALAAAPVADPDLARYRALQAAAFRQPDVLPIYGSSEVVLPDPYHARELFARHPTGFQPFPFGELAGCCLLHVQKLAALGPELRGKRVVVSCTPGNFRAKPGKVEGYAFNFSRLDANELAFSTRLSRGVKRTTARRMLQYPATLDDDPLLRFALEELAADSPTGYTLYLAALPLGRLQTAVLRLQDHYATLCLLRGRRPALPPRAAVVPLDWTALADQAEQDYRPHAGNNPFGFDDRLWREQLHGWVQNAGPGSQDDAFRRELEQSPEWDDLDALLRALHELGARPLLLSTPVHGAFLECNGVSRAARQAYHDRLAALARAHGVPLADFADHEDDRYFLCDTVHLSSKGWVYYGYALDAFYHGRRRLELVPAGARTPVRSHEG